MKVDYDRGLIFWKRKAYPLSEVKDSAILSHPEVVNLYEIYKGVKDGQIERKFAWDSIFFELKKNGLDGIMRKMNPVTNSKTIEKTIKKPMEPETLPKPAERPIENKPSQKHGKSKPAPFILAQDEKNVLKKHFEGIKTKLLADLAEVEKRLRRYK